MRPRLLALLLSALVLGLAGCPEEDLQPIPDDDDAGVDDDDTGVDDDDSGPDDDDSGPDDDDSGPDDDDSAPDDDDAAPPLRTTFTVTSGGAAMDSAGHQARIVIGPPQAGKTATLDTTATLGAAAAPEPTQ